MATNKVNLFVNEVIDNSSINGVGNFTVLSSGSQNNIFDHNSIRVVVTYTDVLPSPSTTPPRYSITCVLESSNGSGQWFPVAYQFEPMIREDQGNKHILLLSPSIVNFDEGVPIDVWNGFNVTTRQHKQQGKLGQDYRLCIQVNENQHGVAGSFQSAKVTAYAETFDA